ncbi:MAG: head maturation protease, ClpP-related [Gemmobacter sp.]
MTNRGLGTFRAEGDTLWLYDAIAADEDEAGWLGGIGPMSFIAALARTSGPVTLRVNSPGGSVFGAQAMVAAIRAHPAPVTARVDSLAASAASVVVSECAECVMAPGAMMMIHKAWGMTVGNADDHLSVAALLGRLDEQIAASYARRAGREDDGAAYFLRLMAAETWLDADEAVAAGLADRVETENLQRPAPLWDLSAYAAAPWAPRCAPSGTAEDPAGDVPAPAAHDAARGARARRLAARLAAQPI